MQMNVAHKHKHTVGYQIVECEIEDQDTAMETRLVSSLTLSSCILASDSFSDILILTVSNNQKI